MIFYSLSETLLLIAAAILVDWIIGDPKWPTHPVIYIGKFISRMEALLRPEGRTLRADQLRRRGIVLALTTMAAAFAVIWGMTWLAHYIHLWLGYAVSTWFIASTIAVTGLKDAAMLVYRPLAAGNLADARRYTSYIVSRDTAEINERDAARAAIETVAENIVDAFISPLVFAFIGGAPLAMLYRAGNTLDSMVGYRNERYVHFGWASARWDDVLNYIPARISGVLLALSALVTPRLSGGRAIRAILQFARRHPSPNSGIPESAAAGAIGIELGGINYYFGQASERARLGWPLRELVPQDIIRMIKLLYLTSLLLFAGVLAVWLFVQ